MKPIFKIWGGKELIVQHVLLAKFPENYCDDSDFYTPSSSCRCKSQVILVFLSEPPGTIKRVSMISCYLEYTWPKV